MSEEFPKNISSDFTVRLLEPLQLEERAWEAVLLSLSIPDTRLQLDEFTMFHADHLVWVNYLADNTVRKDAQFTVDDLTKTFSITDGVGLMKAIVGMLECMHMETVQTSAHDYDDLILSHKDFVIWPNRSLSRSRPRSRARRCGWSRIETGHGRPRGP